MVLGPEAGLLVSRARTLARFQVEPLKTAFRHMVSSTRHTMLQIRLCPHRAFDIGKSCALTWLLHVFYPRPVCQHPVCSAMEALSLGCLTRSSRGCHNCWYLLRVSPTHTAHVGQPWMGHLHLVTLI